MHSYNEEIRYTLSIILVMLRGIAYFVTNGIIQGITWSILLRGMQSPYNIIIGLIVGVGISSLLTVWIRQGSFSEAVTSGVVGRIVRIIVFYAIIPTFVTPILVQIATSHQCNQLSQAPLEYQLDPLIANGLAECSNLGVI